jgi:hypothetical protein
MALPSELLVDGFGTILPKHLRCEEAEQDNGDKDRADQSNDIVPPDLVPAAYVTLGVAPVGLGPNSHVAVVRA